MDYKTKNRAYETDYRGGCYGVYMVNDEGYYYYPDELYGDWDSEGVKKLLDKVDDLNAKSDRFYAEGLKEGINRQKDRDVTVGAVGFLVGIATTVGIMLISKKVNDKKEKEKTKKLSKEELEKMGIKPFEYNKFSKD